MQNVRKLILICCCIQLCINLFAQEKKKENFFQRLGKKEIRLLPVPSLSVTTENGIMGGAILDYYYTLGGKKDNTNTRPSVTWLQLLYSTKRQIIAEMYTGTFTKNEKFYIVGRGGFLRTYEKFWAYDKPLFQNSDYLQANMDKLSATPKVFYQAKKKLFVGLQFNISTYNNTVWDSSITSKLNYIPTYFNSSVLGTGPALLYDKRDNQFSPNKGPYVELGYLYNKDVRNNTYQFSSWYLDVRNYLLKNKHHFSYQVYSINNYGTIPFFEKNKVGGNVMMRGMFQGRFRADKLAILQGEYRYAISNKVKLAAFGSACAMQDNWKNLSEDNFQAAGGAGIRLLLDRKKTLYARLDFATSTQGEFGYYLKVGDAF
jgi:hypothetical protein